MIGEHQNPNETHTSLAALAQLGENFSGPKERMLAQFLPFPVMLEITLLGISETGL